MRGNRGSCARARGLLLCVAVAFAAGCNDELHLSVLQLEVGPDPARPGDQVRASVEVNILPTQGHAVFLFIDGEEHLRQSNNGAVPVPLILPLGDAATLIETYGAGEKEVWVEVRLDESGRLARSRTATFVLEASGGS